MGRRLHPARSVVTVLLSIPEIEKLRDEIRANSHALQPRGIHGMPQSTLGFGVTRRCPMPTNDQTVRAYTH